MCNMISRLSSGNFEVGKSSLLTALTGVESEAAAYEFTTLTCIPGSVCWEWEDVRANQLEFHVSCKLSFGGVINYNDCKIQLLDLPGIISGAAQGKGWAPEEMLPCCSLHVEGPKVHWFASATLLSPSFSRVKQTHMSAWSSQSSRHETL